jgi:hypothetical protein
LAVDRQGFSVAGIILREFEVARDQVAQYRQGILPDAKKSLELTRAGYQQSEFGYLELLTAQQTYSRTNLAYIARLRELWLSAVQTPYHLQVNQRSTVFSLNPVGVSP